MNLQVPESSFESKLARINRLISTRNKSSAEIKELRKTLQDKLLATLTLPSGQTLLHTAIIFRDIGTAKKLIQSGASVAKLDGNNCLPIHLTNDYRCVKLLVKNGSPMTTVSGNNYSPLQNAILGRRHKTCKYLLRKGANRNIDKERYLIHVELVECSRDKKLIKIFKKFDDDIGGNDEDCRSVGTSTRL